VVDNWLIQLTLKLGLAAGNVYGNVVVGGEPKIRITAEARSEVRLHHLYDNSLRIIKDCMEGK